MNRLILLAFAPLALSGPAWAAADPHAGHVMPAPAAADPHAGHVMPPPAPGPGAPPQPAPEPPGDHAADRIYDPAAMAAARAVLAQEHGGGRYVMAMLETAELRPDADADGYAWEGRFWYGGDINRLVLKSEGEGDRRLERAEAEALYARAVDPYFNLQAGLRQDLGPGPRRSYAGVGVAGLAPYWFEIEAMAYLSDRGGLSARVEGSYDLRLTRNLVLEPRAEFTLSADDAPSGAGGSSVDLGLRLRYAAWRTVQPYVGLVYERKLGAAADRARAGGEEAGDTRLAVGLRTLF